jgi:hypothetical protein
MMKPLAALFGAAALALTVTAAAAQEKPMSANSILPGCRDFATVKSFNTTES